MSLVSSHQQSGIVNDFLGDTSPWPGARWGAAKQSGKHTARSTAPRVVLLDATHRQPALAAYALILAMAVPALALLFLPQDAAWVLILSAATYLLIFLAIDRRWHRFRNEP
jgi:hypothetical protein